MLTVMLKLWSDVAGPADPDRGVHQPITRCSTTRPQQPGPLLRYMKIHAGVSTVMIDDWWWLVSLETTNFWLLPRDKKMIFFSCIWQYPACLPIQGRRGRRRERAPGRLPLFALPLPDHVPPENSFAITLNTSEDQEMTVYCVCFVLTEFGKLLPIIFLVLTSPI